MISAGCNAGGELYLVAVDKKKRDAFLHMDKFQQQGGHGPTESEVNRRLEASTYYL